VRGVRRGLLLRNTRLALPKKDRTCFDYQAYLHAVGQIDVAGEANAVAADGAFAYLAVGSNGLQIVDVSDPHAPALRGAVSTGEPALDVALGQGIVCLACGREGLVLVDVADPDAPRITGSADTPGSAKGVAVSGTTAFVADDVIGLMLFDVGDPTSPVPLGVDNTPGEARNVAVSGAFAYVTDAQLGMRIVNVTDIMNPWFVRSLVLSGTPGAIVVEDGFAYIAAGASGLHIIDISTPGAEAVVSTFDTPGSAEGVAALAAHVFVADGARAVRVIDVSTPTAPVDKNVAATSGAAVDVVLADGLAFVAQGSEGLRIIDSSNPTPPTLFDRIDPSEGSAVHAITTDSVFVYGTSLGAGELFVAEVDAHGRLRLRGSTGAPQGVLDLVCADGYVYLAAEPGEVHRYDVRNPDAPTGQFCALFAVGAERLAVADSVLYAASGGEIISILPFGSDDPPVQLRIPGAKTRAIAVDSAFAYVGSERGELLVVQVDDPASPQVLARMLVDGAAEDMRIEGDRLYILTSDRAPSGRNGIAVYDIFYPDIPRRVAFVPITVGGKRMAMSLAVAYVAAGRGGLEIVDVSSPATARVIGAIGTDGESAQVSISSWVVFVADGESGLYTAPVQECAGE
jgi:hypothetical protein